MKQVDIAIFAFFLLVSAASVLGHGGVDDGHKDASMPFLVDIESRPVIPIQNEAVKLTVHVESPGDEHEHLERLKVEAEILRERIQLKEDPENLGHYRADYTFTKFGQEEMTIFIGDVSYTYAVDVLRHTGNSSALFFGIVALAIGLAFIYYLLFIRKKLSMISAVGYSVALLAVVSLGYSVSSYYQSEAVEGCMIKVGDTYVYHCHQNIRVEICGETKGFDWEGGDLNQGHTHKGDHRVHWHPDAPSQDPGATMTLRTLFSDFKLELTENTIQDPKSKKTIKNSDNACNNDKDNMVRVFEKLEGSSSESEIQGFLDYQMKDEANYKIAYE